MHHCKLSSSAAKLKLKSPPLLGIIGNIGGGGCCGRSFGRRLEDQPTVPQSAMESATVHPLPVVLSVCCDYLRCHLNSEGLFRIEGSKVRQRDLRARLERGLPIRDGTPVQDVSSLLKAWLRELPEPLLPPRLAAALAEASPLERRVRLLRQLGQLMPARQLAALRHLCQLLRAVAAAAGSNRMTAANLATCLGPSLHGGGDCGGPDVARLNAAVALLIEFAPEIGGGCGADEEDEAVNAIAGVLQTPPSTPQQPELPQQPLQKLLRRRSSGSGSISSALRAVGRAVGRLASRSRSRSPRRAAAAAGAAVAGCSGSPVSLISTSSTSASTSASSTSTTTATAEKQLAGFRFDPSACHTPIIVRCHRRQNSEASLKRAATGVILVGNNSKEADKNLVGEVVEGGLCCVRRRRRLLLERISAGRKASVDLCRLTSPPPRLPSSSNLIETPQQQQQPPPPPLTTLPIVSQSARTPLRRLQRSPRDSLHVLRQARRLGGAASPRRPDRLRGVRRLWSSPLRMSQNARLCLLRAEGLRPA